MDAEIMRELYRGAKDIAEGNISEYEESRSVAVNYDILVRKYSFSRFSLITRAEL
jgi:hypothetical protein